MSALAQFTRKYTQTHTQTHTHTHTHTHTQTHTSLSLYVSVCNERTLSSKVHILSQGIPDFVFVFCLPSCEDYVTKGVKDRQREKRKAWVLRTICKYYNCFTNTYKNAKIKLLCKTWISWNTTITKQHWPYDVSNYTPVDY